jgi:hypothetical protein
MAAEGAAGAFMTGLPGLARPVDQVIRRRRYEAANPDADIRHGDGGWTGELPGFGQVRMVELRDLLDILEDQAGQRDTR